MGNPLFKRKIYDEMLEWKEKRSKKSARYKLFTLSD